MQKEHNDPWQCYYSDVLAYFIVKLRNEHELRLKWHSKIYKENFPDLFLMAQFSPEGWGQELGLLSPGPFCESQDASGMFRC